MSVRRRNIARVAVSLLLIGMFVDYGGGLGLKYALAAFGLAIGIAFRAHARAYPGWHLDMFVLAVVPWVLTIGATLALHQTVDVAALVTLIERTSGSAMLVFAPIFAAAGSLWTAKWLSAAGAVVSVVLTAALVMASLGVIDLNEIGRIVSVYRVGYVGDDPRFPGGLEQGGMGNVSVRIAFVLPLALGVALVWSSLMAGPTLIGIVILRSIGVIAGGAIAIAVVTIGLHTSRGYRGVGSGAKARLMVLAAVIAIGSLALGPRLLPAVGSRVTSVLAGSDQSTQIRQGHWRGFVELVQREPASLLIGAGTGASIDNPLLDDGIKTTEISSINLAMWFGVPYLAVFWARLGSGLLGIWRLRKAPGLVALDIGLVGGALGYWISGNSNPQLTSPISYLALVLLALRRREILESMGPHQGLHRPTIRGHP
jgi:hypothetical protein